ncbi:MAG: Glycosyltransferase [Marinobacter excellens HL-55]|uniref:Glycosyltransferase n=1 Tax=Marinobacter excellens HL-55 TaxID=1305731 RepID=A0A0P7ZAF1_9GAMM|nr:MAG: Glycosyltransferase [Marinobacter excellens HL-55]
MTELEGGLVESSSDGVVFDLLYRVKGGFDYYRYSSEIKEKLREQIKEVDVVVIRVPSSLGAYAHAVCVDLRKPYITEVVGCAWDSMWHYGNLAGKVLAPIKFLKMRRIVRDSTAALYVTKHFLQEKYPFPGEITENASNVHIGEVDSSVLEVRLRRINIDSPARKLKIGMLSNVGVKYKGFSVAIKALQKLKQSDPGIEFELLLAGGGAPDYVKGLIDDHGMHENVRLVGQLSSGHEVLRFLDDLDVFLQPSLLEGLPRATIEAMSRGCPVLASSAGGIPELIDQEFLHQPGDVEKLSRDLRKVLSDADLQIFMARKNYEIAKNYTDGVLSRRRVDFYTKAFKTIQ